MRAFWTAMTTGDRSLILALLAVALFGIGRVASAPAGGRVVVTDGSRTLFTAPLAAGRDVEIKGSLGPTRITIDSDGARVTAAPCPRRICMSMGPIRKAGELIACIPNHILVRVDAPQAEEAPFDLISR